MDSVRSGSLFGQILSIIDWKRFERLVLEHKNERGAKGLRSWDQMVAMLFCHLAQARSLREITAGLLCCESKLKHLGVEKFNSFSAMPLLRKNVGSQLKNKRS